MKSGRFVHLVPGSGEIERVNNVDIGEFESGEHPRWFAKLQKLEFPNGQLLDHPGRLKGTDVFVAQPYWLGAEDLARLLQLCTKYALKLDLFGYSSWFPGETLFVRLKPSAETYVMLKLKMPRVPAKS
jgi:hypothetical protein